VAAEVGGHERAHRRDAETARADVVERVADEAAAGPLSFLRGCDFCVHEDDHAWRGPVPDPADDLAVAENLVAELLRIALTT